MIDVVMWKAVVSGQGHVCNGNITSRLATMLLMPVFVIQGHDVTSYQVSFPFTNLHLDQDISSILKNEADVHTLYSQTWLLQSTA
jgi:hypothetical protein